MEDSNKIDVKDVYKRLSQSSQAERSNLWQKLFFPGVFLLIFLVMYLVILFKLSEPNPRAWDAPMHLSTVAYTLATLGVVFSIIWIKMINGSKVRYETHETALNQLEANKEYATKATRTISRLSFPSVPEYGNDENNDNSPPKAGAYSIFKLHIVMGQVFLIFWLLAFIVHGLAMLPMLDGGSDGDLMVAVSLVISLILLSIFIYLGRPSTFRNPLVEKANKPKEKKHEFI